MMLDKLFIRLAVDSANDGGEGSGNFGHKGRPGIRGGSGNGRSGAGEGRDPWKKGDGVGYGGKHYKNAFRRMRSKEIAHKITQKESSTDREKWEASTLGERQYWGEQIAPGAGTHQAFNHYSWQGDRRMNSLLRGGGIYHGYLGELQSHEQTTRKEIDKITKDINSHTFDRDVVLFRGIQTTGGALAALGLNINPKDFYDYCGKPAFVDSLVGYTFRDDGFSSSTIKTGGGFSGPCQIKILAPKGSHGTYMKQDSKFKSEEEVLLQRGTQFAITSAKFDGGRLMLEATIIDQTPQEIPDGYWTEPNIDSSTVGVKKGYKPPEPLPKPGDKPKKPTKPGKSANLAQLSKDLEAKGLYVTAGQIKAAYENIGSNMAESIAKFRRDARKAPEGNTDAVDKATLAIETELLSGHISPEQAADLYEYMIHDTVAAKIPELKNMSTLGYWNTFKKVAQDGNSMWNSLSDNIKATVNNLFPTASLAVKANLGNSLENYSTVPVNEYISTYLSKAYNADY